MIKKILALLFIAGTAFAGPHITPKAHNDGTSLGLSTVTFTVGYIYDLHSTSITWADGSVSTSSFGGGGTSDHSALTNLPFSSSGHTGFQMELGTNTWTAFRASTSTYSGDSGKLGMQLPGYYATQSVLSQVQIDTGTLSTNLSVEINNRISADQTIGIATGTSKTEIDALHQSTGTVPHSEYLTASASPTITGQWNYQNRIYTSSAMVANEFQTLRGASAQSIQLFEAQANGDNYIIFSASANIPTSLTFYGPIGYGTAGQAMLTDGVGGLYFGTVSTEGGGEFLVSPSSGILGGALADPVKISTGNLNASGWASTKYLRGDNTWATPTGGTGVVETDSPTWTGSHTFLRQVIVSSNIRVNSAEFVQSATDTGYVYLQELTANGINYSGFKSSASLASNSLYTLPPAYGTGGQVMTTLANGDLYWATVSGTGDMTKAVYDTNDDGIVGNSNQLGGKTSDFFQIALGTPTWTAYDSYRLQGSTFVSANNITAGTLPWYVMASSLVINSVYNANIVSVAGTKITGEVGIANGGTNASSFNANKFIVYDGSKLADTAYGSTDFQNIGVSTQAEANARIAADNAIGVSTGTEVSNRIAADQLIANATAQMRLEVDALHLSTSNVLASDIKAGTLPVGVIASSVGVNVIIDNNISGTISGSKIGSGVPTTSIANGVLGASVIASSISVTAGVQRMQNGTNTTVQNVGNGTWQVNAGGVGGGDVYNNSSTQLTVYSSITAQGLGLLGNTSGYAMLFDKDGTNSVRIVSSGTIPSDYDFIMPDAPTNIQGLPFLSDGVRGHYYAELSPTKIAAGILDIDVFASALATGNYFTDVKVSSAIYSDDSDELDGQTGSYYQTPANMSAGTFDTDVISSSQAVQTVGSSQLQTWLKEKTEWTTISISTPYALIASSAQCISNIIGSDVVISTIIAKCIGGGSAVVDFQQRAYNAEGSAGGIIVTGNTLSPDTLWRGAASFGDSTMPANYSIWAIIKSVTGEVGNIIVRYRLTP